ncbi:MAG: choice-of-anchor A family protein [Verrucomicrobia bacterium]|nr:MAG: choice-of-anchor A family protein [Verrucomicrobiota bacterium]
MRINKLLFVSGFAAVMATAGIFQASAQVVTAVQSFASQFGTDNVVVTGDYIGNNSHVHGGLAVGGDASLSGVQVNQDNVAAPVAFRIYGQMTLGPSSSTVQAGGGVFVQNASTNAGFNIFTPNPGQASITSGSTAWSDPRVFFNGNGGGATVSTLAAPDGYFSTRASVMQNVSATLAGVSGLAPTVSNGGAKLTFTGVVGAVKVYDWDVATYGSVTDVEVVAPAGSNVVINLKNIGPGGFAPSFNFNGANPDQASRTLFNIPAGEVTFSRNIWGSVLAPNSKVTLLNQNIDGSVFVRDFEHNGGEVHRVGLTAIPEPSTYAAIAGGIALMVALGLRARRRRMAALVESGA